MLPTLECRVMNLLNYLWGGGFPLYGAAPVLTEDNNSSLLTFSSFASEPTMILGGVPSLCRRTASSPNHICNTWTFTTTTSSSQLRRICCSLNWQRARKAYFWMKILYPRVVEHWISRAWQEAMWRIRCLLQLCLDQIVWYCMMADNPYRITLILQPESGIKFRRAWWLGNIAQTKRKLRECYRTHR